MKKLVIGSLVGGILVFLWQTLSWTALMLHEKEYKMAPNQEAVIQSISSQLPEEGQYLIPTIDPKASQEEIEKAMESMKGKPWAVVNFHKAENANMVNNIIRGFLVSLIGAFFVTWVLMKNTSSSFGTTFLSTIFIGLAGYLYIPYAGHIWFQNPGATTNLIDVLLSWGLCGAWLGWWLNRK